ncbi:MAG: DNA recombination protein RmuC [Dethiosulfatibacter sp.]|nr:DNA recombination protein RmuC [Dethiosulfatibacter sp.]
MIISLEWMILYALLALVVLLVIAVLVKQTKLDKKDFAKDIKSDLRLILMENNSKMTESVLLRIASSEEKQQRTLNISRLETIEKLQKNTNELTDAFLRFQNNTSTNINESNLRLTDSMTYNFNGLNSKIEENLERIGKKVDDRLNEGFEKTNKTFNSVIERLSKIDEAQKKIDSLSTNIISLQDILTDKKSRGTFGEVQLNGLLKSIFGEKNDKVFEIQKTLPNGSIADAAIHIPDPIGLLCIDSKFPLENYQRMIDKNISSFERLKYERDFKTNVKKHINDISSKYIIGDVTSNQAIMFVPAEAIFAEINAYHVDLIEFARDQRVWMASPTTLMSVLSTVQVVLKNIERDKYTSIIHEELKKLGEEFGRYKSRWDSLAKDIDKVSKDVREINVTSGKIEKRFAQISNVDIETGDEEILPILEINKIEEEF